MFKMFKNYLKNGKFYIYNFKKVGSQDETKKLFNVTRDLNHINCCWKEKLLELFLLMIFIRG